MIDWIRKALGLCVHHDRLQSFGVEVDAKGRYIGLRRNLRCIHCGRERVE